MNASVSKILRWSVIGGVVAFAIDWLVSGGQPLGTRIMVGIMCFGAGFVTGGMIAANFSPDPDAPPSGHGGSGHATPPSAPAAPTTPPAAPSTGH